MCPMSHVPRAFFVVLCSVRRETPRFASRAAVFLPRLFFVCDSSCFRCCSVSNSCLLPSVPAERASEVIRSPASESEFRLCALTRSLGVPCSSSLFTHPLFMSLRPRLLMILSGTHIRLSDASRPYSRFWRKSPTYLVNSYYLTAYVHTRNEISSRILQLCRFSELNLERCTWSDALG